MTRRWYVWIGALLLLSLAALFPLRFALDWTLDEDDVLTARQVGGTVWSGRLGEAAMGSQRLGTFDVALSPLPLFIGRTEVRVERLEDPEGPLEGRFFLSGPSEGIASVNGRLAVDSLVAPLPIEAFEFDDVDLLFDDAGCKRASGTLTALPTTAVPFLTSGMTGPVTCEGDVALATLAGPRGGETVELRLSRDGMVESSLRIASPPALIGEILRAAGFTIEGSDYVLTSTGRLR